MCLSGELSSHPCGLAKDLGLRKLSQVDAQERFSRLTHMLACSIKPQTKKRGCLRQEGGDEWLEVVSDLTFHALKIGGSKLCQECVFCGFLW